VLSFDGLSLSYGQTNQDCMAVGICRDGFLFWTSSIFDGRNTPLEGKNVVLLQQPSPNQSKNIWNVGHKEVGGGCHSLFQELSKVVSPVRAELKACQIPQCPWWSGGTGFQDLYHWMRLPRSTVWCVPGGTCTRQWPLTIGGTYTREVDTTVKPPKIQKSCLISMFFLYLKSVETCQKAVYLPLLSLVIICYGCHSYYAYFL